MPTDYEIARDHKLALSVIQDDAYAALKACNPNDERGPMGLTPDHIKNTPEWQQARAAVDRAGKVLRDYNRQFLKLYKKEWKAEVMAKRGL